MDKSKYKECYRVSDADNAFLEYYCKVCDEGTVDIHEEGKHYDLGYKYTDNPGWYYQYDRSEKHYYIVVDKKDN